MPGVEPPAHLPSEEQPADDGRVRLSTVQDGKGQGVQEGRRGTVVDYGSWGYG